ncbi:hypothetical protein D0784_07350 [Vibrio campbellii]|uniref:Uncharacterized protein n=1 Tax=Vibrio rotiferianus TaxID=190895 RepID=A0ABX3DCB7_9VIBR|nr:MULTISPECIES: hypothetical protein [Vibrio harveyi group]AYO09242.1 hypothetical protein D0784_07350 [Vibrio campbellii]OHY95597.1 hypothetical protein BI375_12585 [Vibrio rotiferianus]CAH1547228.1 conserved hypothetical protein [Vibrio rotiferianus]CAH1592411.1 conserved hypothetical protein [Vibrio rotiferianus]CAH1593308.1 conserved hypothetical protein [Vibrio rotiferianus]
MNSNLALEEERYQTTIYLNDRPYKVLDIGEGECIINIVSGIEDYLITVSRFPQNQRVIIVDIADVLNGEQQDSATIERALANDLHLLFDVFWLEEVKIHSEIDSLNMNAIYDVVRIRDYSRSLLSFEQQLEEKKLDAIR